MKLRYSMFTKYLSERKREEGIMLRYLTATETYPNEAVTVRTFVVTAQCLRVPRRSSFQKSCKREAGLQFPVPERM